MEAHPDQGFPHQSIAFSHGRIGMQVTADPFLGIHSARPRGDGEAGSISGRFGVGIVRRFRAEINLKKAHGVHWKRGDWMIAAMAII